MSNGKTPLFAQVSRWMRRADERNQVEQGLSRRTFLKGAALTGVWAAGLGSLAASPATAPKILIVGGGIAGLVAADRLRRAGLRPRLMEGSNRAGGRIWSGRGILGQNLVTEIGGEFIDSGHRHMRRLARRFDLDLLDVEASSERQLGKAFYFGGRLLTEAEIIAAFQPVARLVAQDQEAVVLNDYTDFNQRAFEVDHTSLETYLQQVGATGWLRDLLNVAYLTEYGCETSQQSALNLVFLLGTDTSGGFKEFGESDQRYKVKGGNDQITSALARGLEPCLTLDRKLVAVRNQGDGFRCTFQAGSSLQDVEADILLLTLPFSTLRDVDMPIALPGVLRSYIQECGYGTNAKLAMGFRSRYWRNQGLNGMHFTDLPIQSGWDSSQLQRGGEGSLTVYAGGLAGLEMGQGSLNQQRDWALGHLEQLFPGAQDESNGKAFRFHWPTHPWTKGSYTCFAPGQYTAFAGAAQPVGNLYFAGEHLSLDFQGYMEGGATTGKEAAEAILRAAR